MSIEQNATFAFIDLGERISRAIETLEVMSYDPRRAAKIDGLEFARDVHSEIAEATGAGIAGWREFTERIFAVYVARLAATDVDVRHSTAGLALALEYQRGYGADVDAPPLHILLAGRGIEVSS